jgi:tetratricopeptide (TPR) repeat protein
METRAQAVHRLFAAAAELAGPARTDYLQQECGDDPELRSEVEALLRFDLAQTFFPEEQLALMRRRFDGGDAAMPERIGAFRLTGVLGRGGMGVVYRAVQDNPAREVALKVLLPGLAGKEAHLRFALEAEALGRLHHPGIAQIHEAGAYESPHGPRPFLAMELVRGETLGAWAARARPPLPARIEVLIQICEAVHHAHQRGLVHRDLKPGNVFVDEQGRAKVLDFGIARFVDAERQHTLRTKTGELLGTLAYMSPEQANGAPESVDTRSDVYAIGVLGYELLTAALPVDVSHDTLTVGLRRLVETDPVPLGDRDRSLRGDLETIFAMALRKEPERRYGSAQAFAADLRRFLGHEPIAARPATATYVLQRFARRHRGLVVGSLLAATALALGTFASVLWAMQAARSEVVAREEARVAGQVTEMLRGLFVGTNNEFAAGRDLSSKELVATARRMFERAQAQDPVATSRVALILGEVLVAMGDFAAAEQYLQQSFDALRGACSGDDPRLVEALHVRAWALVRAQQFAAAGPLYAEALLMHRRLGATSSVTTAKCLEGLATVAAREGNCDAALALLAEARPLREQAGDALRLAAHWQNVATTHLFARQLDQADAAFARAEAVLPPTGAEASAAVLAGNIGNLRLSQQRLPEAEIAFRRALQLAEAFHGADSPRLLGPLNHLGAICAQDGRLDEAEELLTRALALAGDDTKSTDRSFANLLGNLGKVCAMQERLPEAIGHWQRAAAMERRLRPGSAGLLALLTDLANAMERNGDAAGAMAVRAEAESLRKAAK